MKKPSTSTAVLVNMIPPYRVPVFDALLKLVPGLVIVRDKLREADRSWVPIDPKCQIRNSWGTLTFQRAKAKDAGRDIHLPLLLLQQLITIRPKHLVSTELGVRTIAACIYKLLKPKTSLTIWLTLSMRTEISVSSLKTNLRKLLLLTADSVFVSSKSAEKYVRSLNSEVPVVVCAQTGATQVVETKVSKVIGNGHASKPLKLIFVGSGAPRKNLEKSILWLSAWAEQTNTTVKLMAVGDFESVRTKESSRLSVEYASYLEGLELTQCYDKADALFFPTLEDEWGIVVNESLGRGLAVIGSLHSEAVVDLVQDQPFGFSFCPDDYLSFCAAMDKYKVAAQSQESFLGSSSLAIQCALNSSPKKFAAALASCVK